MFRTMTIRTALLMSFLTCCLATQTRSKGPAVSPPSLTKQPDKEMSFKDSERMELPCEATGQPQPVYRWEKDGQPFVISGAKIKQKPGTGTLVFELPGLEHEGTYQCFASNKHGTAVGIKALLRQAKLEPFPSVVSPEVLKPKIGESLTLRCHPPVSHPTGLVYWGENRAGSKMKAIDNNDRVSLDYRGYLHFAHVTPDDERQGHSYICAYVNMVLRTMVQGADQKIVPDFSGGGPRYRAPEIMWSSPTTEVAIKGETKRMKCIFSGYPTPSVYWRKVSGVESKRVKLHSSGQEIEITDVQFEDAGAYQCIATNQATSSEVTRDFQLIVESLPYWRERPPEDVSTSEEENAEFMCLVNGVPKPEITWTANGKPLSDLPPSSRLVFNPSEPEKIEFRNVTKNDIRVLQCNASNTHGYIFANAFLNVLAEPPTFTEKPKKTKKAAIGQTITLKCRVFGAPKPKIQWQKDGDVFADPRINLQPTGDLEIKEVALGDAGEYECYAYNKFGSAAAIGKLVVREKTVIADPPQDQQVQVSSDVIFRCRSTTDEEETEKLSVTWERDGYPLDVSIDGRLSFNEKDHSLTIRNVRIEDSGRYTCKATNQIDSTSATARLTVKDRPSPPYNIRLSECSSNRAQISWILGSDNNDPIIENIVYFNTTGDEPGEFHVGASVRDGSTMSWIDLFPYNDYNFHVTSRNSIGVSDRSAYTRSKCSTPPAPPYRHPHNVCTESRDPHQLVIVWEPMLRLEHNGEDFHYVVTYRRIDLPNAAPTTQIVRDWRQSELVVRGQEIFKKYEIWVEAVNREGSAPSHLLHKKFGYSGEDIPQEIPDNFQLLESTLNSTSAQFTWDPVDESMDNIRGFFKGYQIRYWKVDNPTDVRAEDIIINSFDSCPSAGGMRHRRHHRRMRSVNRVVGHTHNLWPYSTLSAGVLVLNGGRSGHLSQTITFTTPEGVPSEVVDLVVSEVGSHHLQLSWKPPKEANGKLIGYTVGYKEEFSSRPMSEMTINNPQTLHRRIRQLRPDTVHILYVWARTSEGKGIPSFLEKRTARSSVPDQPQITGFETDLSYVIVKWKSSNIRPPRNPGSEFIVQFKKEKSTTATLR